MPLSAKELKQRVNLIKRVKETLKLQRDKFFQYLNLLEHEKTSLETGHLDKLEAQVALEDSLVQEIVSVQRVLDPLESMAREAGAWHEEPEVEVLKENLVHLQAQVLEKNRENRQLLSARRDRLGEEIVKLGRKKAPGTLYRPSGADLTPSLVDVRA